MRGYTGVDITASGASVGGDPGLTMRNVIAGNFQGVWMHDAAADATVSANFIGD